MEFCHNNAVLRSRAIERLGQFVLDWRAQWASGTPDFERFEHELHEHIMAVEREFLAEELAAYDVTVEQIEVRGISYRWALSSPETYLSSAGPITVSRSLYRPAGRGSKSICPMEMRAGIIRGYWTPRAARQAAFATAHLTPGQSEALFDEMGGDAAIAFQLGSLAQRVVSTLGKASARVGGRLARTGKRPARGGCIGYVG